MSATNRLKWPVPCVETQAMRLPSGDRRGSTLTRLPEVSGCSRPVAEIEPPQLDRIAVVAG